VLAFQACLGLAVLHASSTGAAGQTGQTSAQQAAHDDHGPRPDPARIHRFDREEIRVTDFDADGYVLDIGGGGEGVIGQLKPRQVVAIDLSARELLGAPAGPLKIVMDATDLKFLDASFQTATSFFTLMYMKADDQGRALREIHRVLAPGGRLLVWDVILPARFDPVKDIAVIPLTIHLPEQTIETGYGTFFPKEPHDLAYFRGLAAQTGFEVAAARTTARTFYLELRKPQAPASHP
jgi:SAM-dependent methyltransferase